MAGKGGGAWKVAYADFVTAMMAFFLVMWIVAQNKPVREAVGQYFRDPSGYGNRAGSAGAPMPVKDSGSGTSQVDRGPFNASKVKPNVASHETISEERTAARANRITLGGDDNATVGTQVPFAEESAELEDPGKKVLDTLAPELQGKICKIEIRGHASGRKLPAESPFKNAWELSFARSTAAMNYLLEKGIDVRRIRLSQSGAYEPNIQTEGTGRSVDNSRVEVFVLNEVITDPSGNEKGRGGKKNPKRPRPRPAPAPEAPH